MNGARDEIFANCKQYLTVVSEVSFPSLAGGESCLFMFVLL